MITIELTDDELTLLAHWCGTYFEESWNATDPDGIAFENALIDKLGLRDRGFLL